MSIYDTKPSKSTRNGDSVFELAVGDRISRPLRISNAPDKSKYVAYVDGTTDKRVILIDDQEGIFEDGINHVGDTAILDIVGRYPTYYRAVLIQLKKSSSIPIITQRNTELLISSNAIPHHPEEGQAERRDRMTFYFKVGGQTYYLPISKFDYYHELRRFAYSIKQAADEGEHILVENQKDN